MTFWQAVLTQIGLAVRKIAGPLLAFLAGKKSGAAKVERRVEKAQEKAREEQHEADSDFERRRRDPDFDKRVRDALRKLDAADGG